MADLLISDCAEAKPDRTLDAKPLFSGGNLSYIDVIHTDISVFD